MTPRRLPLDTHVTPLLRRPAPAPIQPAPIGWLHRTLAVALHVSCFGLFALLVVWPLAVPLASGSLAREFAPVVRAWDVWTAAVGADAAPLLTRTGGGSGCQPVCLQVDGR